VGAWEPSRPANQSGDREEQRLIAAGEVEFLFAEPNLLQPSQLLPITTMDEIASSKQ
jgi:hypothetical protein